MEELVKVEPISGFPEWLPNLRLLEERFIATIREQYQLFGFTPVETPAVERMEVLAAKGGIQRQIYTLGRPEEDGEEREKTGLGLHFDLTVPLARYVVQHAEELIFPFRRYQIQKVWRGERAQKARFREFYQCDIDVIGRGTLERIHDAEMPCVINAVFTALGVPEFQIRISNRKILSDLLAARGGAGQQYQDVLRAIDKSHSQGIETARKLLEQQQLDSGMISAILDLIRCGSLDEARQVLGNVGASTAGLEELQFVMESAVALGMTPARMRPDFSIARGLDYYTSTIYETFILGREELGSICSGGRYDDLASFFTKQKYPGVGISIGLSRLLEIMLTAGSLNPTAKVPSKVLVTTLDRDAYLREYLTLARELREAGIPTEVYYERHGLRDQIGYASSNGIRLAVIFGENEAKQNTVAIRDMESRKQEIVARTDFVSLVQRKLGL
jgi:histidyl-tRNA synthetase